MELWPPNHSLHTIDVDDCIDHVETCDGSSWDAEIVKAWSDEAENGTGDGNTWNDIVCWGKTKVKLRAERKGNSNGRVYKVKIKVTDEHDNKEFVTCKVSVPHSQNGAPAVYDGKAYEEEC